MVLCFAKIVHFIQRWSIATISLHCMHELLSDSFYLLFETSGKHVLEKYILLYPNFIWLNWGVKKYTIFLFLI